jgi:hypothetical protein
MSLVRVKVGVHTISARRRKVVDSVGVGGRTTVLVVLVRVRVVVVVLRRSAASSKVVVGNTRGETVVSGVVEVGHKLLALTVGRGNRGRALKSLLEEVVVHVPVVVGRKVNRPHALVEAVARAELPLAEQSPDDGGTTDDRSDNDNGN